MEIKTLIKSICAAFMLVVLIAIGFLIANALPNILRIIIFILGLLFFIAMFYVNLKK